MTSASSDARPGEQHRVLTDLMRPQVGVASTASDRFTPELDLERDDSGGASVSADVLARIRSPRDLHGLSRDELTKLAAAIRAFLIEKVSVTGGHLGPNLGVVELTIALHRVFDSPRDALIFDTGHQAYPHKFLTGRQDDFDHLRASGGLSGYPSRAESEHDWVESSHASAALSYADGLAKAFELAGRRDRRVVAIVGDGALTGGMCWEAINNIAAGKSRRVIVVVNDNGRSYAPTIGGLADRLASLRMRAGYRRVLASVKRELTEVPPRGRSTYSKLHAVQQGLKDGLSPRMLFADLGIKYLGPIDGHDIFTLEKALRTAKGAGGPVVVHTVTRKGMGYRPAEEDPADRMHACGPIDARTGKPKSPTEAVQWTDVFAGELLEWGRRRDDVVAITAAMPGPTGLAAFGAEFPNRMFDVGIAEQHAVTSAAGLALGGMHPVVAVYSTFLNRAFDQVLMDVALLKLPVTFVLDRAGITGPDGASHNGVWDLSLLGIVPGMRVAAPRDAASLREQLGEALGVDDGPTAIRFPKGSVDADIEAVERIEGVDVLCRPQDPDVLLVAVGPLTAIALTAAAKLRERGVAVAVVDPRWVLPVPEQVVKLAGDVELVVTLEESGLHGGVGSALAARMREARVDTPVRSIGVPQRFLDHASRSEIHAHLGLTADDLVTSISSWVERPADADVGRGE
ncbi:MAG: 1-deoxy-D-xylulose-5-phosphate synthase [Mycobacterium sp.]|uniref:1-deoxy-D-xylulose-5-phosphate synthase n=1 Tax=Mycobacterium sp. TaxID=1785 RepID=UPI003F9630A3